MCVGRERAFGYDGSKGTPPDDLATVCAIECSERLWNQTGADNKPLIRPFKMFWALEIAFHNASSFYSKLLAQQWYKDRCADQSPVRQYATAKSDLAINMYYAPRGWVYRV